MTFGRTLQLMLQKTGYSLVSEFVTGDRRNAVRLRELRSSRVIAMYHCDAIELARGGASLAAIVHRNRAVFDLGQQGNGGSPLAERVDEGRRPLLQQPTNVGRPTTKAVNERVSQA